MCKSPAQNKDWKFSSILRNTLVLSWLIFSAHIGSDGGVAHEDSTTELSRWKESHRWGWSRGDGCLCSAIFVATSDFSSTTQRRALSVRGISSGSQYIASAPFIDMTSDLCTDIVVMNELPWWFYATNSITIFGRCMCSVWVANAAQTNEVIFSSWHFQGFKC